MSTICIATTDIELNTFEVCTGALDEPEKGYDTAPMAAILPRVEMPDEEELHTQFEQAISGRLAAYQQRLSRLSSPLLYSQLRTTEPLQQEDASKSRLFTPLVRRYTVFTCAALSLMMVGFDIMGLMMLHMH